MKMKPSENSPTTYFSKVMYASTPLNTPPLSTPNQLPSQPLLQTSCPSQLLKPACFSYPLSIPHTSKFPKTSASKLTPYLLPNQLPLPNGPWHLFLKPPQSQLFSSLQKIPGLLVRFSVCLTSPTLSPAAGGCTPFHRTVSLAP